MTMAPPCHKHGRVPDLNGHVFTFQHHNQNLEEPSGHKKVFLHGMLFTVSKIVVWSSLVLSDIGR